MDKHLPGFCKARQNGTGKACEFVEKRIPEYYEIYHHRLGLQEEPSPSNLLPDAETLATPVEQTYKGLHIAQMQGVSVSLTL